MRMTAVIDILRSRCLVDLSRVDVVPGGAWANARPTRRNGRVMSAAEAVIQII
jgi:hypothetical protein